jgi:hypothetical protein
MLYVRCIYGDVNGYGKWIFIFYVFYFQKRIYYRSLVMRCIFKCMICVWLHQPRPAKLLPPENDDLGEFLTIFPCSTNVFSLFRKRVRTVIKSNLRATRNGSSTFIRCRRTLSFRPAHHEIIHRVWKRVRKKPEDSSDGRFYGRLCIVSS